MFLERQRIAVEGRRLAHHPAHEVAALGAEQHRDPVGADDREMLAIAGDEQIGDRRRDCPDRADEQGNNRPVPHLAAPQSDPQPGEDQRGEGPARHRREHRHRALGPRHDVREVEDKVDRPARCGPQRRAEPDGVEDQRERLERHDDERGERDGDEIGRDPVQSGLVEMI